MSDISVWWWVGGGAAIVLLVALVVRWLWLLGRAVHVRRAVRRGEAGAGPDRHELQQHHGGEREVGGGGARSGHGSAPRADGTRGAASR